MWFFTFGVKEVKCFSYIPDHSTRLPFIKVLTVLDMCQNRTFTQKKQQVIQNAYIKSINA